MKQDLLIIKRALQKQIDRIDDLLDNKKPEFLKLPPREKVEYLIKGVCDFWDMEEKDLFKKNNTIAQRRGYLAFLLRDYTEIGYEDMAKILHHANHSTTLTSLKNMDDKLSNKPYGDSRMRAIYENLIEYLELPPSKYYRK